MGQKSRDIVTLNQKGCVPAHQKLAPGIETGPPPPQSQPSTLPMSLLLLLTV